MTSNLSKSLSLKTWLRFLPYGAFGILVFVLNSTFEANYLVKGYVALLECQAGIVVLYFLMQRLSRQKKLNKN